MSRIRTLIAALTVVMVGGSTLTGGSAVAGGNSVADWEQCYVVSGFVCLWQDTDGKGWMLNYGPSREFHEFWRQGYGDQVTSWANNAPVDAYLFDWNAGRNCWELLTDLPTGYHGTLGGEWNDRADALGINYVPPNIC